MTKIDTGRWKGGRGRTPEDERVRLMRAAKTRVNYTHGMGGLPKQGARKPKPITLPKTPWDDKPEN